MYFTCGFAHMRPDLWSGRDGVPVMIVASNYLSGTRRLRVRPAPPQCRPLFADCGGFFFALKGRDYPFTWQEYVAWLAAMQPDYAACMDYPCEAEVAADDAAVRQRQLRTLAHAGVLLSLDVPWQWIPVLQGRTVAQYRQHAQGYRRAGLHRPYMGIGSLCRRTRIAEISAIVRAMTEELPESRFHLFGVKSAVFQQRESLPAAVASADSGAWNGMFGQGRTKWKRYQAMGYTQARYEVDIALPHYQQRVDRALALPKQLSFGLGDQQHAS